MSKARFKGMLLASTSRTAFITALSYHENICAAIDYDYSLPGLPSEW